MQQSNQSHSPADISQDLKTMQAEIEGLLHEINKKNTELLQKLRLMNSTDAFLNAFISGQMFNVKLSKFFKEKELQNLIRTSHGIASNDAPACATLRERLNNFKERQAYDNAHPIADMLDNLAQNIAPTVNKLVPSTRPIFKAAYATYSFFNSRQATVNQANHQLTP